MTDEKNTSMDQIEFMKRMKAIASDLWGGILPAEESVPAPAQSGHNGFLPDESNASSHPETAAGSLLCQHRQQHGLRHRTTRRPYAIC